MLKQLKKPSHLLEKLFDYQRPAVEFTLERKGAALFCEQRTGKTYITGGVIAKLLINDWDNFQAIGVVPLTNLGSSWLKLFKEYFPGVGVSSEWSEFMKLPKPRIYLINYESLGKHIHKVIKQHWTLAWYDESQRIKAPGSSQSRQAARIKLATHKLILSGTPVEQTPMDLWSQFRFCCPWIWGYRKSDFIETYCKSTGFMGYKKEFIMDKLPEFLDEISPWIMRITRDVFKKEEPEIIKIRVKLRGKQRRAYDQMFKDMLLRINGKVYLAPLKISQMIRLQQICGGFIIDQDKNTDFIGRAKIRKLKTLLKTLEEPIVIFAKYREEIHQIKRLCNKLYGSENVRTITGAIKGEVRTKVLEDFQNHRLDIVICQTKTGGVGIDLFAAYNTIVYSMTFSYIDFEQLKARTDGHGQINKMKIYLLIAENTIDEYIWKAILLKHSISGKILNNINFKGTKLCLRKIKRKVKKKQKLK